MPTGGGDPAKEINAILLKHGYHGVKKIGEGSFGVAVLTEGQDGYRNVCKMVNVTSAGEKERTEARKEARLLAKLKHPYIVRYRESFNEKGWLCIVMDFCDGGDLAGQIENAKTKGTYIQEVKILRWLTQAMLALKFLHDKHVLHRDLKPNNLFLTSDGDLRVGDFGISKVLEDTCAYARTFVGTPYYIAPEVIDGRPYSWSADVWSMGCILYHLCAKEVPWEARNLSELSRRVLRDRIPGLPDMYCGEVKEVYSRMMERNIERRATVEDIVNETLIQDQVRAMLAEKKSKAGSRPQTKGDDSQASGKAHIELKHEIIDQFNRFDQNGDGEVDRTELATVLTRLDKEVWTEERIDQIIEVADCNKDGRIQLTEFVSWIFGGSGNEVGLVEKVKQMIEMALQAAKDEKLDVLGECVLRWRQAVDVGCLRVSDPDATLKTCEALAHLGRESSKVLDIDDPDTFGARLEIIKHMGAILDSVARILGECSRRHVLRVAGASSRNNLRGLCFELIDGTRLGTCPAGTTDAGLDACAAKWEDLEDEEHIVQVKGYGSADPARRPSAVGAAAKAAPSAKRAASPPPGSNEDCLASSITLCTDRGRELSFGGGMGRGNSFNFKAGDGLEIEDVQFEGKTCVGILEAPFSVSWPPQKKGTVQQAFQSAIQSVSPLLLRLGLQVGLEHWKYARLQARQLGMPSPSMPDDFEQALRESASKLRPPNHWHLSAMPTSDHQQWWESDGVGKVGLNDAELTELQALLTKTFQSKTRHNSRSAWLSPGGLELVWGERLQNWRDWVAFKGKEAEVREAIKTGADADAVSVKTAGAHPLGIELDQEVNSVWLFHHIDSKVADTVAPAQLSDQIVAAGGDLARLYGRGIYFKEKSNAADELASHSVGGLRCMLLCRVVLGRALQDDAVLPDVVDLVKQCVGGSYHSVIGDREKHWPKTAHREFVVYDSSQVYPEFVLWCRRVYK